jgi:hypothetical protein
MFSLLLALDSLMIEYIGIPCEYLHEIMEECKLDTLECIQLWEVVNEYHHHHSKMIAMICVTLLASTLECDGTVDRLHLVDELYESEFAL